MTSRDASRGSFCDMADGGKAPSRVVSLDPHASVVPVTATATATGPKPHEKLWFSDGTIVLATDVHMYRVHKGMLAKYSTVRSDMFEMPTGESNTDCWEGVPIVRMVGDKDEEISNLLEALFDRQ